MITLEEQINLACRDLPHNAQIHLVMENGAAYVQGYYLDNGDYISQDGADMSLAEQVKDMLEFFIEKPDSD